MVFNLYARCVSVSVCERVSEWDPFQTLVYFEFGTEFHRSFFLQVRTIAEITVWKLKRKRQRPRKREKVNDWTFLSSRLRRYEQKRDIYDQHLEGYRITTFISFFVNIALLNVRLSKDVILFVPWKRSSNVQSLLWPDGGIFIPVVPFFLDLIHSFFTQWVFFFIGRFWGFWKKLMGIFILRY